jgi:Protein of unknown function (DUF3761)
MKPLITLAMIVAGLMISLACNAQAPTGSTGECKDGTYTSAASKRGACAGHGGVKDWYESTAAKTPSTSIAPPSKATGGTATAPATPAAAAPMSPTKSTATSTPAAGGGPGQVWVNTASKVYHCQGTKWYGKTKKGEYMTEAAAKAAGNHADHGKACS